MCSARRRSTRRGTRGFSLIEALAASAFVAVALLAFAANSISLTRNEKTADSTSAGHALAQQKLEQMRSMPLGAVQLVSGSDPAPLRADGTAGSGALFTRSWTVSAGDTPTWGLKTVTVQVSWRDPRPHTTQIAAYVRCSTIPCP
jgi:Tfp pilus assembly protein PilV